MNRMRLSSPSMAHPDGKRFLMAKRGELSENEPQHLIWVQNWLDEVERLVPTQP